MEKSPRQELIAKEIPPCVTSVALRLLSRNDKLETYWILLFLKIYKMQINNKIVWITGASSGIGEALCYELVKYDCKLIISSRRTNELERVKEQCNTASSNVKILPLDLANLPHPEQIANKAINAFGKVDILINSGGITQRSMLKDTSLEVDRKIMDIDYFGTIALAKAILPHMLKNKSGHISAISSIVGRFGFPMRSAYSAAKHALHGFFESAQAEMKNTGVNFLIVVPGRVKTNVSVNAITGTGETYGKMDEGQEDGITAEECAKKIVKAISKNKKEVNIGSTDILLVYIHRYAPWLYRIIASRISAT